MELCSAPAKRGSVLTSSEEVCIFYHVVKPQAPASLVSREREETEEVSCSLAPAAAAREILCDGSTA
jgi:hypothetical protein